MSFRGHRPKLTKERVVASKFVKKTSSVLKRKRKYENDYPKRKLMSIYNLQKMMILWMHVKRLIMMKMLQVFPNHIGWITKSFFK